jgi:predicted metal-dependent phosphoesterase TrpH
MTAAVRSAVADLHLHSHHSDGLLAPAALMRLAAERGVGTAALTDHDTTAGCAEAAAACAAAGLRFVPGVEVSAGWDGLSLHVLGLGVDTASPALQAHLAEVRALRRGRLDEVGERLERRAGLPGRELVAGVCEGTAVPTRLHLARALVALGHARDEADAFKRLLGRGTPGHVPMVWPGIDRAIAALHAAGGVAVLAHPHRYGASGGALRRLVGAFRDAGGRGLEVSMAGMSPRDRDRLATLARGHAMLASTGSDFHDPALPWNPPGRFDKLPEDLDHVAATL